MRSSRPVIGVTAEVDPHARDPSVLLYSRGAPLVEAVSRAGGLPVILPHHLDDVPALLDAFDGFVIGGGAHQFQDPARLFGDEPATSGPSHKRRRTSFEMAIIAGSLQRDVPVFGICGGFQTMNAVLGGRLAVNLAQENAAWAVHTAEHLDAVHDVEPLGGLIGRLAAGKPFAVNSLHRQGVRPEDAAGVVTAVSPDGIVEAIEVPEKTYFVGVQWHPEHPVSAVDEAMLIAFVQAAQSRSRSGPMW